MGKTDIMDYEKEYFYKKVQNPNTLTEEDIKLFRIQGFTLDEIEEKTGKNVRDILEIEAIERNKNHFLDNMFQMIENGNTNKELGIGDSKEKYNKKVMNFINKSDDELLKLGFSPEDIIKIRDLVKI